MQVAKWGNSLAVRLPAALVRELGVHEGDELVLRASPAEAGKAQATVECLPGKRELLAAARRLRGPWPRDFVFDRDEANTR